MGAPWSLKLLPMIPNVTFSGYGFVPLLPYLEQRMATPMWQELSAVGILQCLGSEWASSRARSDSLRKSAYCNANFPSSLEINVYLGLSQRPQAYSTSIHPIIRHSHEL
jgi:hypothetical protein